MNSTVKTVVFWLVIVLSAFLLWQVMKAGNAGQKDKEVTFSQFLTDVDQGGRERGNDHGPGSARKV